MVQGLQRLVGVKSSGENDKLSNVPRSKKLHYAFHDSLREKPVVFGLPVMYQICSQEDWLCQQQAWSIVAPPEKAAWVSCLEQLTIRTRRTTKNVLKKPRDTFASVSQESRAATKCGALVSLLGISMQMCHGAESKWPCSFFSVRWWHLFSLEYT